MANSSDFLGVSNAVDSHISAEDYENFYSPLCLSGYLTPLQRKKLREKRNLNVLDDTETDLRKLKKVKKTQASNIKTKRIQHKRKELIFNKAKQIPQLRYSASQIFQKTADENMKDRKFFKTSTSSRLEKANFSIAFVLKNQLNINSDKIARMGDKKILKSNIETDISFVNSEICSESVDFTGKENVSVMSTIKNSYFDLSFPSDEELLERQKKARAAARKHTIIGLNDSKNNCSSSDTSTVKLYPIFYISKKTYRDSEDTKRNTKNGTKCVKDSSKGGEQMIIDAGQKDIGVKMCNACDMIYTIGQEEDEKLHFSYHNKYLVNLKFQSWKEENVIGEYRDGKVIMVRKEDKSLKMKKIEDVLEVANRDLGFPTTVFPTKPDVTFILFISTDKQVVGCVVAERIFSANRVQLADSTLETKVHQSNSQEKVWRIGNWCSSSESVPAVCGINRIWVAREFRRHKVASRMIDCLRCHFIHGHVIGIRELAFTDPSPDGREFAATYTGTDNFLVYNK